MPVRHRKTRHAGDHRHESEDQVQKVGTGSRKLVSETKGRRPMRRRLMAAGRIQPSGNPPLNEGLDPPAQVSDRDPLDIVMRDLSTTAGTANLGPQKSDFVSTTTRNIPGKGDHRREIVGVTMSGDPALGTASLVGGRALPGGPDGHKGTPQQGQSALDRDPGLQDRGKAPRGPAAGMWGGPRKN